MKKQALSIAGIPAILWGEPAEQVYLFVHGKQSSKEYAGDLAQIAQQKGYQTLSFELPSHGERQAAAERCDIWNGVRDLKIVGDYAWRRWPRVCLYGCSLGAFFSLHAYENRPIENCLFQSPIVDMEYLIHQMFGWFGVTEAQLREKGEIPTPVDTLSWAYYGYVREHPIRVWRPSTHVLYGGRDQLQSEKVIRNFCGKFQGDLTVSPASDHPFMGPGDAEIVRDWLVKNL